jgi:exopolysaccharide biosynthesis polyprenyl glycosylphosphotransferase
VSLTDELFAVVRVISLGMLIIATGAFLYREFSFSRIVFALLWFNATLLVFLGRSLIFALERRFYRKGRHLRLAVILGNDHRAADLYGRLHNHPSFGFSIVGYFAQNPAGKKSLLSTAPYLGTLDSAPAKIRDTGVDLAFIALGPKDHPALFEFIAECEGINIEFMMIPDMLEVLTSRMQLTEFSGIPFLKIISLPFTLWGRVIKRSFDIAAAAVLLTLLSPLLGVIALAVKASSRGPVFFSQERVGLDGKPFMMLKFRSMKAGSEQKDSEAGLGIKHDPRRTGIGIVLRKTGLDELPQLLNVLKGEMSLVGPRPERSSYVEQFRESVPKYLDRHRVKTGITGWAQVNGLRGDTSIDERVRYDLYYIENWSMWLDIKILLRTIRAALDFRNVH